MWDCIFSPQGVNCPQLLGTAHLRRLTGSHQLQLTDSASEIPEDFNTHCVAGTFCALDICLSQLQDVGSLNVHQTVKRMRTQRAFSIQTPDQYYFCYNAILEHAQRQGLLPANQ